jgi:membrane protein implicated in regulation of membrane protease activity
MVALGLAGLITALVAISIPLFPSQLLIWGVTSAAFTLVLRSFVPRESRDLAPSRYARVCVVIPAGGVGRVHYEGAIWHARCQNSQVAIAPEALVSVVDRQGNTLIVMPMPTLPSTSR